MKSNIIIVSKMNCSQLTKQIADIKEKKFFDLFDILTSELGNINKYRLEHGDEYLTFERQELKKLLKNPDHISFVSYDIFKHNLNPEIYSDTYVILLDFGYFIRIGDEIVRMKQSIRYQKAKSLCDFIVDCRNSGEENIIKQILREINE